MADKLSTSVVVAVVGAVAGAVVLPVWAWIGIAWNWSVSLALAAWSHLKQPSQWPNGIAYLCAAVAMFFLGALFIDWCTSRKTTVPWRQYTRGRYFGVNWTWRYAETGRITDLMPYCPACQMALQYEESDLFMRPLQPQRVRLHCQDCARWFAEQDGNYEHMRQSVTLYIDRDIRTGEFLKKLNAAMSAPGVSNRDSKDA